MGKNGDTTFRALRNGLVLSRREGKLTREEERWLIKWSCVQLVREAVLHGPAPNRGQNVFVTSRRDKWTETGHCLVTGSLLCR